MRTGRKRKTNVLREDLWTMTNTEISGAMTGDRTLENDA